MLSQYQAEAKILEAQQTQVTQLGTVVDQIDPNIEVEESFVEFPFSKIVGEEAKFISMVNSTLLQFDFSAQSMKAWKTKFS